MTTLTEFGARPVAAGAVERTELVRPGMCGHNAQFVGQVGDWTWDAVSSVCDLDVYTARAPDGAPTYLSFFYYHVRSGRRLHPHGVTFGDRLQVRSRVFDFGSESVHTLHEIRHAADPAPPGPLDPARFYAYDDPDCLYVENFNRWISRSRPDSNENLSPASPVGFRHKHLPKLPAEFSPRLVCRRARSALTFVPEGAPGWTPGPGLDLAYPVDPSRDLNGVGLLYFASYFSIVDHALLDWWRSTGRPDAAFLRRVVHDQQVCYLGNADATTVLALQVTTWHRGSTEELVNVVVRRRDDGWPIAVSTLQLRVPGEGT